MSAARFSSRLASNILTLTLSTPAAPRFRFTAWKACRMSLGVIRPVSECTLIFFIASLSRFVITEFGQMSCWGTFLSGLATFRSFPGKSSGGPIWGFSCGANFPHVLIVVLRLRSVSPFTTRRFQRAATPGLLLPSKRRPLRQCSPQPRFVRTISPVAYTFDLPTIGRGRASPVMTQDHFLQAATRSTPNGSPAITVSLAGVRIVRIVPQCFT